MKMNFKVLQAGLALGTASLLLVGCGGTDSKTTSKAKTTPSATNTASANTEVSEAFAAYSKDAIAVTYDEGAVPKGAKVKVSVVPEGNKKTIFTLKVTGLKANHGFGAHLHTKACGAAPIDAGPHYQNQPDTKKPSTNPKFANNMNEVWMDFTTDSTGAGSATTTVDWQVRHGDANSIVIHAEHTMTKPGKAGMAGDRLACVNVPL